MRKQGDAMTEAEWLACTDPAPMLEFLQDKASDRKLRLFAVACCRRGWRSLRKTRSRKSVEAVEQYADGLVGVDKLAAAQAAADGAWMNTDDNTIEEYAAALAVEVAGSDAAEAASSATKAADVITHVAVYGFDRYEPPATEENQAAYQSLRATERTMQCCLLRCILGNPFLPSPPLPPAVLAWNDCTVRRIAAGIYDERHLPAGTLDTARLAILADALLDAGCDDEELIQHCRGAVPHVRGCWAVDLILGKG
jgi:hypothetical protein